VGGDISLSLVRKTPAALGGFLGLVKELVSIVTPVYGEVRNMSFAGWDLPFDLEKRLPDVPWVSVYGPPPYVALFTAP
jgi:hypothetical protein